MIAFGGKRTFRMTNDCAAENISKKQRGVPTVQNNKNPFFEPRNNRGNGTNFSCLLFLSLFIFFPFTIFLPRLIFSYKTTNDVQHEKLTTSNRTKLHFFYYKKISETLALRIILYSSKKQSFIFGIF